MWTTRTIQRSATCQNHLPPFIIEAVAQFIIGNWSVHEIPFRAKTGLKPKKDPRISANARNVWRRSTPLPPRKVDLIPHLFLFQTGLMIKPLFNFFKEFIKYNWRIQKKTNSGRSNKNFRPAIRPLHLPLFILNWLLRVIFGIPLWLVILSSVITCSIKSFILSTTTEFLTCAC